MVMVASIHYSLDMNMNIMVDVLFSNKMLLFRAGLHKMVVRLANREDPDQTASESSEAV